MIQNNFLIMHLSCKGINDNEEMHNLSPSLSIFPSTLKDARKFCLQVSVNQLRLHPNINYKINKHRFHYGVFLHAFEIFNFTCSVGWSVGFFFFYIYIKDYLQIEKKMDPWFNIKGLKWRFNKFTGIIMCKLPDLLEIILKFTFIYL